MRSHPCRHRNLKRQLHGKLKLLRSLDNVSILIQVASELKNHAHPRLAAIFKSSAINMQIGKHISVGFILVTFAAPPDVGVVFDGTERQ